VADPIIHEICAHLDAQYKHIAVTLATMVEAPTITATARTNSATGSSVRLAGHFAGVSPTGWRRVGSLLITARPLVSATTTDTTFTWPTSFADANYTVSMTAVAGTARQ
jgi:hypothetical protein